MKIQASIKQNWEDITIGKKKSEPRAHKGEKYDIPKSSNMIYVATQSTSSRPSLHKARA